MEPVSYKLGNARRDDAQRAALRLIKQWTRARFSLTDDDLVLVTEEEVALPGVPPRQTLIVFQCADGLKRHYRIFKPAAQVLEDDLPPAWMKDGLITPEGYQCSCC
jgi:nitrate reductase delta subunit